MRLFYFTKSRPRLLSRRYNLCTFPPIVANISCGALVSLDTTTVIDISLRKKLTYTIFYLWSSRNPAKRFCSFSSLVSCIGPNITKAIIMIKKYSLLFPRIKTFYEPLVVQTLDSAIHRIVQWITQLFPVILVRWIVIYPVDSAIQCLSGTDLFGNQSYSIISSVA